MTSATIQSVLQENRIFSPAADFVRQANISGMAAYQALCDEAEHDFTTFANPNVETRRMERAELNKVPASGGSNWQTLHHAETRWRMTAAVREETAVDEKKMPKENRATVGTGPKMNG